MLLDKIILEEDEVVLTQTRRHWFILFSKSITLVLATLFPALITYFALSYTDNEILHTAFSTYVKQITYLYTVWILFFWMGLFSVWTNYYLDILTVTNKRVVLVDQIRLFHRSTGSFRLERLQDINVDIHGIIETFLDFGTLEAQTASGSEEEFRVHGMPHPRELRATILRAVDEVTLEFQSGAPILSDGV